MILRFDDEELCSNFLLDHHTWKDWFSTLDPWVCQSLPFERLAWVRILGVPIHLADNDVLNNIAEHYGRIVHGSQFNAEDGNLSLGWIGLLVGEGDRIHDQATLKWRDKQFRVWIEEELCDWAPDSIGRVFIKEDNDKPSEEFGSDDDSLDDGDTVKSSEFRPVTEENERSKTINADGIVEGGNDNFSRNSGNGSYSENLGEQSSLDGGARGANDGCKSAGKEGNKLFFFKSADQVRRPKKRIGLLRLRSKTQSQQGVSSPNSCERPKNGQGITVNSIWTLIWILSRFHKEKDFQKRFSRERQKSVGYLHS
ncbi:hypothetical protein HanOQP8_Chr12g0461131 [Helianthus annuus]|nr:hypothetical protein HanOQP8_Chr12g0461131 [Helianthus annuus]